MIRAGYDVIAVAPKDDYSERLTALGCRYIELPMDNKGKHPLKDLMLFVRFCRIFLKERPDVFLGYTVKPNVYGSLAAHLLGIKVINNVAGLGAVFIQGSLLSRFVSGLYRLAFSRSFRVFFQNDDDLSEFVTKELVDVNKTHRLPGSGVDLVKYGFHPLAEKPGSSFRFLLVARMLWDKGIGEYVEAARLIKQTHSDVEFDLLGFLDVPNPAAISRADMNAWVEEGVVNYLGETDDVIPYLVEADCIVLPSYREGLPRTLLEAAAIGRPIITTDTEGCRDAIDANITGYLVEVKNAKSLASSMMRMIQQSIDARQQMGKLGRNKVEREFDEKIVINEYMKTLDLIGKR